MKNYNVNATDENVLNSIADDKLNRTRDVKDFIDLLETLEDNSFIALDGAWGDGKTFLVRQIEMTLRYHNKIAFKHEITEGEKQAFADNGVLGKNLHLKRTYLPIYFNAWLYDNHSDALMALLLVAIKQCNKYVDTKLKGDNGSKIVSILDALHFWNNNNWKELKKSFTDMDILSDAYFLEEVSDKIKEVFNDILVEEGEKLVIFVDELDRCRPTFAVEVLESIKHFFEDDRIIFVVSTNKAQLIHTISNYYGVNFDSVGYLNKFFDLNIQLPEANSLNYFFSLGKTCNSVNYIFTIAKDFQKYFNLSLRDTITYFQKINLIDSKYGDKYADKVWGAVMVFVSMLCLFDIVDITKKRKILKGKGKEIIKELFDVSSGMKEIILRLNRLNYVNIESDNYENAFENFMDIYDYAFLGELIADQGYEFVIIYRDIKDICLRICNNWWDGNI